MDPAVQIEDVVGNVVSVNAVDRVADVLPRRDDYREREQDDRADAPVEAKHWRVDVDVADLDQCLEPDEYVKHRDDISNEFQPAISLVMLHAKCDENSRMEFGQDEINRSPSGQILVKRLFQ